MSLALALLFATETLSHNVDRFGASPLPPGGDRGGDSAPLRVAVPPWPQDAAMREIRSLRQAIREKRAWAAQLLRESHRALDRGDYEVAFARHRAARRIEIEVEGYRRRLPKLIETAVASLVADLESTDIDVRDESSLRLVELGPSALPEIEKAYARLGAKGSEEARARLKQVILRLREMTIDEEGRLRQWAAGAKASSEYTETDWSAKQATGAPDTTAAGDSKTAWASREADGGDEWLELTFEHRVRPTHLRVHETFNPGAVVKIEALVENDRWRVLWSGQSRTTDGIRWFTVTFEPVAFTTRAIRITLDSANVAGWNEIDAVELIGEPGG